MAEGIPSSAANDSGDAFKALVVSMRAETQAAL
jgi:hypothetical protein